jgi:hypothetical protein
MRKDKIRQDKPQQDKPRRDKTRKTKQERQNKKDNTMFQLLSQKNLQGKTRENKNAKTTQTK